MSERETNFDVIVIGGGVIGLAVGWKAAKQGFSTLVIERGRFGQGAAYAAAGMLAPVSEAQFGEQALLDLNLASAERYPEFVRELEELTGKNVGYQNVGTLSIAHDRDEAEALERMFNFRRRLGLSVHKLRPSELRKREPAIAPTVRMGLDIPDDHAVNPRLLVEALELAVATSGGELLSQTEVVSLLSGNGAVEGVQLADGISLKAPRVVIAAGCWSNQLQGIPSDLHIPLRPVKGQALRLFDRSGPDLLRHVLRMADSYLVPRGDGNYVLGATVEEQGFDQTITAGATRQLLDEAAEILPGIDELELIEITAGLRPGTPDNAPIIGATSVKGLYLATGHYRHGILLAPITADLVSELLLGESADLVQPFSPQRFSVK